MADLTTEDQDFPGRSYATLGRQGAAYRRATLSRVQGLRCPTDFPRAVGFYSPP
jgi:hypothetical protein